MIDLKQEAIDAIKLRPLERVPASFFAGGVWSIYNSGNTFEEVGLDPERYAKMLISTQEKLQNNIIFTSSGFNNFVPIALGGELKKRSSFLNLAPDLKASIINSIGDIDKIDLPALDRSKYVQNVRAATKEVVQKIGDKVMISTTCWGPFTMAGQMRGVSDFLSDLMLDQEFSDKLMNKATDIAIEFFKPYAEAGIDMATISEPTGSGDMISLAHFEKVVMPQLSRLSKEIKQMGIPYVLLHICGWTEDRLSKIPETGADIFSLDHRVDISKAKASLKDKICFAGNVDPVRILKDGKPEDVEAASRKCVDNSWYGRGYILMPGCDLPDAVPLKNLETMLKSTREYNPRAS
jgi:uroporphyrinogen decarboxylase